MKEELSGRTTVVIRDQAYGSEATIEIYATSIESKLPGLSTPIVYCSQRYRMVRI